MKKLFLIFLFLGLCLGKAAAQQSKAEELLLKQVSSESSFIRQEISRDEETKVIQQRQAGGNAATLAQDGFQNSVLLQQLGFGNTVNLTQRGNENLYEGYISGDHNSSVILQAGNQNMLVQDIKADGQTFNITQQGDNNKLLQIENGVNTIPIKITQQGNGINLIIENGTLAPMQHGQ